MHALQYMCCRESDGSLFGVPQEDLACLDKQSVGVSSQRLIPTRQHNYEPYRDRLRPLRCRSHYADHSSNYRMEVIAELIIPPTLAERRCEHSGGIAPALKRASLCQICHAKLSRTGTKLPL